MAIPIITRTNTVDEWRIQTNQSATNLNSLETGSYEKSNGTLTLSGNSALVISSNGTALQVANSSVFQSNVTIGRELAVGAQETATGNVTVGGITTLRGPGTALQVSNNALIGNNLQVTQRITVNNITANSNVMIGGNEFVDGILRLTGVGDVFYVNTGIAKINTAIITDSTTTNAIIANAVIENEAVANSYIVYNVTLRGNTVNLTSARANITSLNVETGVVITGNVLTLNTNQAYVNTANIIGVSVSANAYINKLQVNTTANVTQDLGVTANIYGGNVTTTGTIRTGSFVSTGSANIGGSTFVTGNVQGSNSVVTNHSQTDTLRTSGVANVGSGLTVSGNVTTPNIVNSQHIQTATLRTSGVANVGSGLTVSGNEIVSGTLSVTGNTNVSNVVASGLIYTNTLTTTGAANVNTLNVSGGTNFGTTLNVTGNTTSGNLNTTGLVHAGALRTTGRVDIGSALYVASTTLVDGSLTVNGNFTLTGTSLIDSSVLTLRSNTPQPFGSGFTFIGVNRGEGTLGAANANSYIRWNEPAKYWDIRDVDNPTSYSKILTANLISDSLTSSSTDTVATSNSVRTLNVRIETANTNLKNYVDFGLSSGNAYAAQANTDLRNYVDANLTLRAASANSYALTQVTTANSAMKSYVDANLTLRAASANSYALTTVNAANTSLKAYVDGTIATSANSYALTTVNAANTSLKAYVDGTVATASNNAISAANTSLKAYVDGTVATASNNAINTANNSLRSYVDANLTLRATSANSYALAQVTSANSAMKTYVDTTFFTKTGGTISGDAIITGNLTVSGTQTIIDTQQLNIGDNVVVLNADLPTSTSPSVDVGIEVNRGSSSNTRILWNETTDRWTFTNDGVSYSNFGSAASEVYANSAYSTANISNQRAITSGSYANSAYLHANAAFNSANNVAPQVQPAYNHANAAFNVANTDVTTISVSGGTYGNSTYTPVITITANGRISAIDTQLVGSQITDDNSTDTTQYLTMARSNTGSFNTVYVSSSGLYFNPNTSTLNATIFNSLSDETRKTNVKEIEDATETLNKISGVEFDWIDNGNHSSGVIAQELEKVLPFLIDTSSEGIKSVNYSGLIAYLIQSNKELSKRIEKLEYK